MGKRTRPFVILMADDDAEDRLLVQDALGEISQGHVFRFVSDGEELFDYLRGEGAYANAPRPPRPDLILLDLKMPKKDGREVLRDIKADPDLKCIPVVALTTSNAADDVGYSYRMGVNSYVRKPTTFRDLVEVMAALKKYWFELVELPPA
jgi:CheY-like chemotaxis protein